MVEYKPATCAWCDEDTWCETRANGKPQCRACKVERFFSEVLYPPLGYRLMDWQRKVLRGIYGNPDPITGLRRYRSAYISVGKKNGKSFLIGGLPLYHLLMENEHNPEAVRLSSMHSIRSAPARFLPNTEESSGRSTTHRILSIIGSDPLSLVFCYLDVPNRIDADFQYDSVRSSNVHAGRGR